MRRAASTAVRGREAPPVTRRDPSPTVFRRLGYVFTKRGLRLSHHPLRGLFELGRRAGAVVRASVLAGLVAWNDRGHERVLGSERRRNIASFIQRLQRRAQERSRLLGLSFRGKRHGPGRAGSDWGRCPARPAQLLPRHVRWTLARSGSPDTGSVIAGALNLSAR